ncbi:twin-arginine translocase TatA/TatE family subunit [Sphingomicrobium astaxanthinifaciens]|uniref:twin-arginine translocase TatA/TatE family subunit n=1 Tax=Sphingomicrobium astaxanthinifaciens TaxID=1227949 RepID=UPI001FCB878C|nr:twin-arginine translocase TatA/TatE family subunit [Sphingomicrobium astaxanthinifaciens]MCJ7421656.1 twin-arginine translocase TatA/TatE family subunit [Sphingomicrobium astaxanthinifaciens]
MGNIGLPGILILAFLVLLLFGRGRFSSLMGDVAQGLKSFKKGMAEEDETPAKSEPRQLPREDQTIEAEVKRDREQDKPAS